jgi:hypothetical protein
MSKQCTKCKEIKPLTEFFKDKYFKDGYYSKCKVCKTEATYLWRHQNPDKYNKGAVKWRDKNPDKQHATDIKRHYGLDISQYNAMLAEQNNSCKICKKPHAPTLKRGRLYVDHCHTSKEVRGLLCSSCNSAIGYFNDSVDLMLKAIDYIKTTRIKK